jgi:hypothetical protein
VGARRFTVTVADAGRGRLRVPVPFDPDDAWGPKPRHPIRGTVDGARVRGVVEPHPTGPGFLLGAAWVRDHPIPAGSTAEVEIAPEGPQRDDLADDVAAALAANPEAARFFDGLPQFYRRAYLRWVDSTKRSPQLRQQRITAMVELLEAGVKDHRAGAHSRTGSSST